MNSKGPAPLPKLSLGANAKPSLQNNQSRLQRRGLFLAALSVLLGSLYPIGIMHMVQFKVSALQGAFAYMLVATIISFPFATPHLRPSILKKLNIRHYLMGIVVVFGLVSGNILLVKGTQYIDPASVQTLNRSEIIFSILLGSLFLRERVRWYTWVGLLISVMGMPLFTLHLGSDTSSKTPFWAYLLPILSGILFAVMTVAMRYINRIVDITAINSVRLLLSTLAFALILNTNLTAIFYLDWQFWFWVFVAALAGPVLFRTLLYRSAAYIGLPNAMLISILTPVVTGIYQIFFFGIILNVFQWLGMLLVVIGVGLVIYMDSRAKKQLNAS